MVTHTDVQFPESSGLTASINRVTRKDDNVYVDALGLAELLFDDHMAANMILFGAAYQAGAIPVSAGAIEQAIALNGVSVAMNTQAFQAGRLVVADPAWARSLRPHRLGAVETAPVLTAEARALVDGVGAEGELRRLLEIRVPELIAYQHAAYARSYVDFVRKVVIAERGAAPGETGLAEAVARYLFKLMAYKDEYEVARLHLRNDLGAQLAEEYPGGVEIRYALHPPLLRALGMKKKLTLGRWFDGAFRALVAMRGLRGTVLDPFGHAEVRRMERALIDEYRGLVDKALIGLSPDSHARAVKLASLPDLIRGYESIKLRNVQRFRDEVRALGF
jgi:indolepyruvate ferredoxin oxidoreductase